MTQPPRPKYPMPDDDWERLMFDVIDGTYSDEDNERACLAIEQIRNERMALIARLDGKEKK